MFVFVLSEKFISLISHMKCSFICIENNQSIYLMKHHQKNIATTLHIIMQLAFSL